jgi:hypothetical protein
MLALRDFNDTYGPMAFSGVGGQRAVNAATFLLEGGFLDPIADGLKAAAGGQWMVCPGPSHPLYAVRCSSHGRAVSLSLKQAILLLYALGSVALDARLVSFILRKRPDIPGTLEEMYNAAGGNSVLDRVEIRAEIGRTLTRFTSFSEPLRKQLGQKTKFISRIMTDAVAFVHDPEIFDCPFYFISNVRFHMKHPDVLPEYVRLAATVLLKSRDRADIIMAGNLIKHLRDTQTQDDFLPDSSMLKTAVPALAICDAETLDPNV